MSLTKIAAIICAGFILLVPASSWGMNASNISESTLFNIEDRGFHLSFGVSLDVETGNMTYTIQEKDVFKSKLEWPLDGIVYMGGIISTRFLGRLQANAGFWKSLGNEAGRMKDSDWLDTYSFWLGDDKAIYGEFDTTVNAAQFDVNIRYDILRGSSSTFGPILGYSYTKWEWETGDGYQTSPLPYYNVGNVTGTGIVYEQVIQVPYLGLAFSLFPNHSSFGLNLYTLYSPLVRCDDIDDHLIRYKESTGETEGTSFSLGGNVLWNFKDPWSLSGRINYTTYDLDGYQDQYFYGGNDPPPGTRYNNINMTVEGSQYYFGFMISYRL
jgi:outer membrane protease